MMCTVAGLLHVGMRFEMILISSDNNTPNTTCLYKVASMDSLPRVIGDRHANYRSMDTIVDSHARLILVVFGK